MQIERLTIRDFRNYPEWTVDWPAEGLIVTGPNGTGKTNLLEAVAYLATGRSVRRHSDTTLIRHGAGGFRIEGRCQVGQRSLRITAGYGPGSTKSIRIDDVPVTLLSELYQYLRVIYFSPDDGNLISGSPMYRRRFLDLAVTQCYLDYLPAYRLYEQTHRQRNAILESETSGSEKHAWDERYLEQSLIVSELRRRYLNDFIPLFQSRYAGIADHESPSIQYIPGGGSPGENLPAIAKRVATSEIRRRHCMYGPHLDNLEITLDDRPARIYASQGQRRSLSLALRLAQAEMVRQTRHDSPILIFDDALSELDAHRVEQLRLHLAPGHQIIIATPNPEIYACFQLQTLQIPSVVRT
jgi:DNA replication and repair protein RecF